MGWLLRSSTPGNAALLKSPAQSPVTGWLEVNYAGGILLREQSGDLEHVSLTVGWSFATSQAVRLGSASKE